jgi:hypothetical protein
MWINVPILSLNVNKRYSKITFFLEIELDNVIIILSTQILFFSSKKKIFQILIDFIKNGYTIANLKCD